jgi:hypothetical protein
MTNDEIIQWLPAKQVLGSMVERRERELKSLKSEINYLRGIHKLLLDVDEIYEGVALQVLGNDNRTHFRQLDESILRSADVYKNVRDEGCYGVNIYDMDWNGKQIYQGGRNCGFYFSREEAIKIAKDYVITGKYLK